MKFGDKLVILRKKKGLSQEELAEKLGVSRQSVSKWESNSTYPETDKIVQICNLFEVTMDDLINDNITDVETTLRKNKNSINNIVDSFLDFITKTVNMFSNMKFLSGLKCVIEMIVVAVILLIIGTIFVIIISDIFLRLFPFDNDIIYTIDNIIESILMLIWFIISIIVLVHVFKIRYLNYYEKEEKKGDNTKKEKIIIRDEKDRPFAFLSALSKIIIIFIKVFVAFITLLFIFTLFVIIVSFIVSIYFSFSNTLFIGMDIFLIALSFINIIILLLLIGFIFEKKYNYKILLITFTLSIIVSAIGFGIFMLNLKNIKKIDTMNDILNFTTEEEIINYEDNLIVRNINNNEILYYVDNTLSDNKIKLEIEYDKKYINYTIENNTEYKLNIVNVYFSDNAGIRKFNAIINDLRNNIIRDYDFEEYNLRVYASENTINKLMSNLSLLYNYEYTSSGSEYKIYDLEYKIEDYTGNTCKYDALNDKLDCGNYTDSCYVEGLNNKIILDCKY